MKTLAIAAACLLLATLSHGECVEVKGADAGVPTFQASSRRLRITALQEGKALANVRILFYLTTDQVNPKLALTTDKQGAALAPDFAPGQYRIFAIGPDHESAEAKLEVADKGKGRTNSFLMAIPPTFPPEEAANIDAAPITEHLQELKGYVTDSSGAFVAGALVQVFRTGAPTAAAVAKIKADNEGSFVAALTPGKYVVFISSQGFRKKIVGVEIGPEGEANELRVEMRIFTC